MTPEGFMKAEPPGPGKEHRSPSCGSLADMGSVAWATALSPYLFLPLYRGDTLLLSHPPL